MSPTGRTGTIEGVTFPVAKDSGYISFGTRTGLVAGVVSVVP